MTRDTITPAEPVACVLTPAGRPCAYPLDAILTEAEAAAVLDIDVKTLRKYPIKVARPSERVKRYLYRDVVAFLDGRAA